jgi:hypothetical protein
MVFHLSALTAATSTGAALTSLVFLCRWRAAREAAGTGKLTVQ